ncbi:acyl-CoA thioesterase [Ponticoccus gilvus]|nr:acyl-CoA thioesterase [Enemella evansiae]
MTRHGPSPRADWPSLRPLQTRWKDNDALGHMNNAEYLSLFDTAISLWQIENGIAITGPEALRFVVVENGCRYFAEAGFPDTLHAGLRLGHLGRSSFRFELALFRNTEERACTEAFFAMVLTDADGRPTPLPDRLRAALTILLPPTV